MCQQSSLDFWHLGSIGLNVNPFSIAAAMNMRCATRYENFIGQSPNGKSANGTRGRQFSVHFRSHAHAMKVELTDLKIDWIWHLSLKIEAGVIGPTLLYFSITKSHFFAFLFLLHPYDKYKWNKNAKNVIYNGIYLLKYSKVGPVTCIVCHVN